MKLIAFYLLLFTTFFAYSQISTQVSGIDVIAQFSEPSIYRVGDTIFIDVKIVNNQPDDKAVLIAQDKRYSFDFEILTMQNKKINHSPSYSNFFNRVQPIFNSMVRLSQKEGFTYRVCLNDYYDIDFTGQYYIRCNFYPELKLSPDDSKAIKSNYLTINIRPKDLSDSFVSEKIAVEEEKKLFAEKKAPDEVIDYMLKARINNEWEKYFLYLDLDSLILMNTNFASRYRKSDSEAQIELKEEYKKYLKQNTIDDISYQPVSFKIVKTEYSAGDGKVEAILKFKQFDFVEDKYYTFFLKKRDNKWFVTSYKVLNMGAR